MISFVSAQAQWDESFIQNPGTGKYLAGVYGNADYSSNTVTSAFAGNFIEDAYSDDNLKNQVSSNLVTNNRLGFSWTIWCDGGIVQ